MTAIAGEDQAFDRREVARIGDLDATTFLDAHLRPGKPVVVTNAMAAWTASIAWSPAFLRDVLGHHEVPVYDDLFDVVDIVPLAEYVESVFMRSEPSDGRYVRWYSRFSDADFLWADAAFADLRRHWSMPTFLPTRDYIVPSSGQRDMDVTTDLFPYRGLFVSGRGSRTRMHHDPWTSSAILCQIYGHKRFRLYAPDPEAADASQSEPIYHDVLAPGEIVFIPGGWRHDFVSLSPSISLTWNFVHRANETAYRQHCARHPDDPQLEVARYFTRHVADLREGAGHAGVHP